MTSHSLACGKPDKMVALNKKWVTKCGFTNLEVYLYARIALMYLIFMH
jgi:hypothetical protein